MELIVKNGMKKADPKKAKGKMPKDNSMPVMRKEAGKAYYTGGKVSKAKGKK